MKVLERGNMKDGTNIIIENWHKDYSFKPYGSTVASFPKSKANHRGQFEPKEGEEYRFSFDFKSNEEAKKAYNELIAGIKKLSDFKGNFTGNSKYLNCFE